MLGVRSRCRSRLLAIRVLLVLGIVAGSICVVILQFVLVVLSIRIRLAVWVLLVAIVSFSVPRSMGW